MATTGESAPTRLRSMRTSSISIALTSSRRTTTLVGVALRSTQVQLPISRFLFDEETITMTMTMTTLLTLGFLGYKSVAPERLVSSFSESQHDGSWNFRDSKRKTRN